MQTWTGCSDIVALARFVELPDITSEPFLQIEPQSGPGFPSIGRVEKRLPQVADEVTIAAVEELGVGHPGLSSVQITDSEVAPPEARVHMDLHEQPARSSSRALWKRMTQAPNMEPKSLFAAPEEPSEGKPRIWIQPLNNFSGHRLDQAGGANCPLADLPDPGSLRTALTVSNYVPESQPVDEFDAGMLALSPGLALQGAIPAQRLELEYMLYPATRRIPNVAPNALV
jgi:hypothetical protein